MTKCAQIRREQCHKFLADFYTRNKRRGIFFRLLQPVAVTAVRKMSSSSSLSGERRERRRLITANACPRTFCSGLSPAPPKKKRVGKKKKAVHRPEGKELAHLYSQILDNDVAQISGACPVVIAVGGGGGGGGDNDRILSFGGHRRFTT